MNVKEKEKLHQFQKCIFSSQSATNSRQKTTELRKILTILEGEYLENSNQDNVNSTLMIESLNSKYVTQYQQSLTGEEPTQKAVENLFERKRKRNVQVNISQVTSKLNFQEFLNNVIFFLKLKLLKRSILKLIF